MAKAISTKSDRGDGYSGFSHRENAKWSHFSRDALYCYFQREVRVPARGFYYFLKSILYCSGAINLHGEAIEVIFDPNGKHPSRGNE